jgi:hypothetical protein
MGHTPSRSYDPSLNGEIFADVEAAQAASDTRLLLDLDSRRRSIDFTVTQRTVAACMGAPGWRVRVVSFVKVVPEAYRPGSPSYLMVRRWYGPGAALPIFGPTLDVFVYGAPITRYFAVSLTH